MVMPSKWQDKFVTLAEKAAKLGATDLEIADLFEVSVRTLHLWKIEHPELVVALKSGKEAADERVERSLYHRATGYSYDAVKIMTRSVGGGESIIEEVPYREHVPPDATSAIFWLKNRRKDEWRDRQSTELSGPDGGPIQTESPDAAKLAQALLAALNKGSE